MLRDRQRRHGVHLGRSHRRSRARGPRAARTPPFMSGACPTNSLCVTVGNGGIATTTTPDAAGVDAPVDPRQPGERRAAPPVRCASRSAAGCATSPPTRRQGRGARRPSTTGSRLASVSCASASLCVATDANGHVVTLDEPGWRPSAWSRPCSRATRVLDGHAAASSRSKPRTRPACTPSTRSSSPDRAHS